MMLSPAAFLRRFACSFLVLGAICADPAMAQRFISNSDSGNDPTQDVAVSRLVSCQLGNTNARINGTRSGGDADLCSRVNQSGETLAHAQTLISTYNAANPSKPYTLQLVNTVPDRLSLGNTVSSGGLFGTVTGGGLTGNGGLGNDHVEMQFRQGAVGSFVMAFSGTYDDGLPGNTLDPWSAYYLFDDVEIRPFGIDNIGTGLMNYKLYQNRSRVNPLTGGTDLFRDYTSSLVVNQASIYRVDQIMAVPVPAPGTGALMALGLAGVVAACRRQRRRHPAADA